MTVTPDLRPGAVIGAVDAGSNAIRFSIYKLDSRLYPLRVHQQRYPVRLGAGTFTTGLLNETDITAAIDAFNDIAAGAKARKVSALMAVATSAIREAANSGDFLRRVVQETGVQLRAIAGEEEARLAAIGVTRSVASGNNCLILDVGGGSSEIIYVSPEGDIIWAQSLPVGAVRLAQEWNSGGWPRSSADYANKQNQLQHIVPQTLMQRAKELPQTTDAIAIGGTAYAVSRVCDKLQAACQDQTLVVDELEKATKLMADTKLENYPSELGVDPERAQILLPGAAVLGQLLRLFQKTTAIISDAGVREGLVYELLDRGVP